MTPARPLAVLTLLCALAGAAGAETYDQHFRKIGDRFLDELMQRRPQLATRLGVHAYDAKLPIVTQMSLDQDRAWIAGYKRQLAAIPRGQLSFEAALDFDLLRARLERERLDLDVIRPFERNPNSYLDLIAGSIQSLSQREFASPCARMQSVIHRLRQVPEVLRAAELNLKHPPRVFTETALAQFPGVLRLYREELLPLQAACKQSELEADLAEADTAAVRAVQDFIVFLRDDLLPRSDGDFRLGAETYQKKLACDEMETMPVDSILARGWRELARTRARMAEVAQRIAPGLTVAAALESLQSRHPSAKELVPYMQSELDGIRTFVREKQLLTPPRTEDLVVRETPAFRRSGSFASMESPGVWETRATRAYFNVTPVDPAWSEKQKQDHLAFFNRWASEIVAIHEAIPGHYYQFVTLRQAPSRLRQALGCGTNTEGWAHYCEQMAIEQGYGGGDPRYELAQLSLAEQRLGRLIVGISLHTRGMSMEDAVKVFEDQCDMAPVNAEREARRGTSDPTYLVYTLGKWRILEMRDELQQRLGSRFKLREFHDAFLRQGPAPLPIVREALMHQFESPSASRGSE